MIMDTVLKDKSYRRTVLPGASLGYGLCSAVMKGVTLLWAIFLVAGPCFDDMQYCITKVRGIVTDFGTEIHTLELPNILQAFVLWHGGRNLLECRPYVDYTTQLFANAMRVCGWCHSWGNLMKAVCQACPQWPRVKDQMSTLVSFFRNKTWRKHVRKVSRGTGVNEDIFKHFSASTAKWRYETYVHCMKELLVYRYVCEHVLRSEHFANAQDKHFIQKVLQACHDRDLWIFVSRPPIHMSWQTVNRHGIGAWSANVSPTNKCAKTRSRRASTFLASGTRAGWRGPGDFARSARRMCERRGVG